MALWLHCSGLVCLCVVSLSTAGPIPTHTTAADTVGHAHSPSDNKPTVEITHGKQLSENNPNAEISLGKQQDQTDAISNNEEQDSGSIGKKTRVLSDADESVRRTEQQAMHADSNEFPQEPSVQEPSVQAAGVGGGRTVSVDRDMFIQWLWDFLSKYRREDTEATCRALCSYGLCPPECSGYISPPWEAMAAPP